MPAWQAVAAATTAHPDQHGGGKVGGEMSGREGVPGCDPALETGEESKDIKKANNTRKEKTKSRKNETKNF